MVISSDICHLEEQIEKDKTVRKKRKKYDWRTFQSLTLKFLTPNPHVDKHWSYLCGDHVMKQNNHQKLYAHNNFES